MSHPPFGLRMTPVAIRSRGALFTMLFIALFMLLFMVLFVSQAAADMVPFGIYCPPNLWLYQATQFGTVGHDGFAVMHKPSDPEALWDLNDALCTAWLMTAPIPVGGGYIQGRPIPGQFITFYAVRENGQTHYETRCRTDAHGQATGTFDDLPVTGRINHDHCAQSPGNDEECYEFYARYEGGLVSQEQGACIVRLACESVHKYMLLADAEVPTTCSPSLGCVDIHGGILSQIGLTLTVPGAAVTQPVTIAIEQPPRHHQRGFRRMPPSRTGGS